MGDDSCSLGEDFIYNGGLVRNIDSIWNVIERMGLMVFSGPGSENETIIVFIGIANGYWKF